jgi:hypothetical protein
VIATEFSKVPYRPPFIIVWDFYDEKEVYGRFLMIILSFRVIFLNN